MTFYSEILNWTKRKMLNTISKKDLLDKYWYRINEGDMFEYNRGSAHFIAEITRAPKDNSGDLAFKVRKVFKVEPGAAYRIKEGNETEYVPDEFFVRFFKKTDTINKGPSQFLAKNKSKLSIEIKKV